MTEEKSSKTRFGAFWQKYEAKIVLVLGFVLVAVISFEAGVLKKSDLSQKPLVIEKPVGASGGSGEGPDQNLSQGQNSPSEAKIDLSGSSAPPQNCAFLGSKNSNKYHLPTCRYAKNISPENITCFSSADEAQSRGYVPDKNCIK